MTHWKMPLLLFSALTVMYSGCAETCKYDSDCPDKPGKSLCLEGKCSGPGKSCQVDSDCSDGEQCKQEFCTYHGKSTCSTAFDCSGIDECVNYLCAPPEPQLVGLTPQQVVNKFAETLRSEGIEYALLYLDPVGQQKWADTLKSQPASAHQEYADILLSTTFTSVDDPLMADSMMQLEYSHNGIKYPIQLMKIVRGGAEVWKIRDP